MTPFQLVTISILAVLVLQELYRLLRRGWRLVVGVRAFIWCAALVAIAMPKLPSDVAALVGVSRGADLVLYLLALTFVATTFYLYSRCVRLQNDLTKLVRHFAILEATRGGHDDTANDPRHDNQ